jgi:hypothetical protein
MAAPCDDPGSGPQLDVVDDLDKMLRLEGLSVARKKLFCATKKGSNMAVLAIQKWRK